MSNKWRDVTMYVCFDFGSCAYLTVRLYDGKTIAECVKMRSEDIVEYLDPRTGKWEYIG